MTQEKKEPCYVQNHEAKKITTKFEIEGNTIEITQRRLTGKEAENYTENIQSVYEDKDVYMTMMKQKELDKELERLQKIESKKKKADRKEVIVPVDDDTRFLIFKGQRAIARQNRELNAKFICYSCSDSETRGGKFLFNGDEVSEKRKFNIISELTVSDEDETVDYFNLLLANANKLTYPTKEEIENVKS